MYWIYALTDSLDRTFYVGRTNNLTRREKEHRDSIRFPNKKDRDVHRYLRDLQAKGLTWRMEPVQTADNVDDARDLEIKWIQMLEGDGHPIVNRMRGQDRHAGQKSVWGYISIEDDQKLRTILGKLGLSKAKFVEEAVRDTLATYAVLLS